MLIMSLQPAFRRPVLPPSSGLTTFSGTRRFITDVLMYPQSVLTVNQLDLVHIFISYSFKANFNIILTSTCKCPKSSFPVSLSDKIFFTYFSSIL
jgi:hypothetical protein